MYAISQQDERKTATIERFFFFGSRFSLIYLWMSDKKKRQPVIKFSVSLMFIVLLRVFTEAKIHKGVGRACLAEALLSVVLCFLVLLSAVMKRQQTSLMGLTKATKILNKH